MSGTRTSPKRAPIPEVLAQLGRFRAEAGVAAALDGIGEMTAVLNEHRQIVFANRAFQDYAAEAGAEGLAGLRPGEILRCANAGRSPEGCGGAEECARCGAAAAIGETERSGRPATLECRLELRSDGHRGPVDLKVRTTPFAIGSERYTLLSLTDISGEKRRVALERVFFHDILNTASGLKAYLDLLEASTTDAHSSELVAKLESICSALVEEIQGQRIFVSAENRTLTLRPCLIESLALVRELVREFEEQEIAAGKEIRVLPFAEGATFVSDDSLVRRILANMLKNALEASSRGAVVSIGCERAEGGEGVRFLVHNESVIPPEAQRQVFSRYFSTKGPDRGLGTYGMKLLGEEYLGGAVRFQSTERTGTLFSLTLPESPPGFDLPLRA